MYSQWQYSIGLSSHPNQERIHAIRSAGRRRPSPVTGEDAGLPPGPPATEQGRAVPSRPGTLGNREAGYNPLGYHTGTIWPHENSLIAAGLARYGHHHEARTIASAILNAAPAFEHQLPEVFAGFPVALTSVPVAFPTASRPQAWAAGAPLLLLSTILGLQPHDTDIEADLPDPTGHISIRRHPDQRPQPTPATG